MSNPSAHSQSTRLGPTVPTDRLALVCDLLSILEEPNQVGVLSEFLGRMAVGFGFEVAAAFFCSIDSTDLAEAQLRLLVGEDVQHWGEVTLGDRIARALHLRPDRAVVLRPVKTGGLALDSVIPQLKGRGWSGVAVALQSNERFLGGLVMSGPRLNLDSWLHESMMVRLARALAKTVHLERMNRQIALLASAGMDLPPEAPITEESGDKFPSPGDAGLIHRIASTQDDPLSEGVLAAIFSSIQDAMLITDLSRKVVAMNPEAEAITGWSEQEAQGKPLEFVLQMVSDLHKDRDNAPQDLPASKRLLLVRKDGTKHPVDGSISPIQDSSGQITGLVALVRDDQHDRHAERVLVRAKQEFKSVIERLPLAVIILHKDVIVFANNAWRDCLNQTAGATSVGRSIYDLLHQEDREFAQARNRSEERTIGPVPPGELRIQRADNGYVEVEVFQAQFVEFEGKLSTMLVVRDLTQTRWMQAQLQTSERMASIGTLAAGIAHEINNPLTYVMSNLNLVADKMDALHGHLKPDALKRLNINIDEARDGAERVCNIVRDLKTLSGREDEVIEPVDVAEVANAAANMASNEIRHRARLERVYDTVPPVAANARGLAQVFLNFLVNAAQSIESGHADAHTIGIHIQNTECDNVAIEFWDDGPGMTEEEQARVFDPFFTNGQDALGTGLGLSISHSIITSYGGQIQLESEVGAGTCFRILLPRASDSTTPELSNANPLAQQVSAPALSILILDDERLVGRALQRLLKGHKVVLSLSGTDALTQCAKTQFDVILCDVMMPQLNGLQFFNAATAGQPDLASRFIFMSGGVFDDDLAQQLSILTNPIIDKPFVEAQILDALAQVTHRINN